MKPEWRRFAPLGLYLALAAFLFAMGYWIVTRKPDLPFQIGLGLTVIGLAAFAALDPARVRQALTGRQARYGSNALVLTLAFVGILVVINLIVYNNVDDWKLRWDLTEDKENTLAPETLDVLESLPQGVVARAFYTGRTSTATAEELLDEYAFNSGGKFSYEFIDPDNNPAQAQAAGVTKDGTIVLFMGDQKETVEYVTEQELTAALIRLMNPGGRVIYFLTGHGEYSLDKAGDDSFTTLKNKLQDRDYTVQSLNLLATPKIPEDASVIVIGGVYKPVSEAEVVLLSDYLKGGGALVVLAEPTALTEFGDNPDPLADYLLKDWGIRLNNDIVVDLQTQQAFVAYSAQYGNHPITEKMFSRNLATAFPTARTVIAEPDASAKATELIFTSKNSWAESDLEALAGGNLSPDEGVDVFGPLSLAVVAEDPASGARVAVFGDSEFAINAYFDVYGNGDMILNTIDWAAGQEEIISLTPKNVTQRTLVPPTVVTIGLILLGSLIVLPGLVVVGGITAWIIRRRRG